MILGVSGHRPNKLGGFTQNPIYDYLNRRMEEELLRLKPTKCISGMALGIDTMFVELCLKHNIPYVAAVPFVGQQSKWSKDDQVKYHELLMEANDVIVVCNDSYSREKFQKRNMWIVDNCDTLLAVYNGSKSGTGNCVEYARKKNKDIIIINPLDA